MVKTMSDAKILDTEKQEAMDLAERSRQAQWEYPSFVAELFNGRLRTDLLMPYGEQDPKDKAIGDAFIAQFSEFLRTHVDADALDSTGELPPEVIEGLRQLGALGMKIDKEYGGLGLSQTNYGRSLEMLAGHCGNLLTLLSAHQSIGAPQPLKLFGTAEQKKAFLPRLTREISAFALTEPSVGSDPAKMSTTATPSADGKHWILNGTKLWCTNGTIGAIIVVMARTPDIEEKGRTKKQISAFLVESKTPGFRVAYRCRFMGLRAIQNAVLTFENVKVPRENLIGNLGEGLKIALTTLNTGRLSLPSMCIGGAKKCLEVLRHWTRARVQWGAPIGQHEEIAAKTSFVATSVFAMDAMTYWITRLVDRGGADIRLEAAMDKLFCTELNYRVVYETLQARGGRGFETAESLKGRGETPIPIERFLRDLRILTIFEGSTEIMHLFIAREALDTHMRMAKDLLNPKTSLKQKAKALLQMAKFYAIWYPKQWIYWGYWPKYSQMEHRLTKHMRFVERKCHKLARTIFHMILWHRKKLEQRQLILSRIVEIGTELFAMAASCAKAEYMRKKNALDTTPIELADIFCCGARKRIAQYFHGIYANEDRKMHQLSKTVMEDKLAWLEEGTIQGNIDYSHIQPSG